MGLFALFANKPRKLTFIPTQDFLQDGCERCFYRSFSPSPDPSQIKSPCGAEGEEEARYPQGLECVILYHFASAKEPAGKCQADATENNSTGDGGKHCLLDHKQVKLWLWKRLKISIKLKSSQNSERQLSIKTFLHSLPLIPFGRSAKPTIR